MSRHHYPTDDAWSNEREEARDAAYDVDWTAPRHGQTEPTPERWEVDE